MYNIPYFNSGDIILQMPEVIEWLNRLGIRNAHCSRYSRYVKHMEKFYRSDMSGITEQNFEIVAKGFSECLDITIIKNAFINERSRGFVSRLSQSIKGQDFLEDSNQCGGRNYLFELLTAAKLKNCGYHINFDDTTDVIGFKNSFSLYGECKRISSKNKFENNFNKAGEQLEQRFPGNGAGKYGIIFLDISALVCENIPYTVENLYEAQKLLKTHMESFINENMALINGLNRRFICSSLGVYLIGKKQVWTESAELFSVSNMPLHQNLWAKSGSGSSPSW